MGPADPNAKEIRLLLEQLAHGSKVIDVAMENGYTSQSAFAAMFKKHFGTTPTAFYQAQVIAAYKKCCYASIIMGESRRSCYHRKPYRTAPILAAVLTSITPP